MHYFTFMMMIYKSEGKFWNHHDVLIFELYTLIQCPSVFTHIVYITHESVCRRGNWLFWVSPVYNTTNQLSTWKYKKYYKIDAVSFNEFFSFFLTLIENGMSFETPPFSHHYLFPQYTIFIYFSFVIIKRVQIAFKSMLFFV